MLGVQIITSRVLHGFRFQHQNIVIHQKAIIGNNFHCVGNNCVGGTGRGYPKIGNNVTLGFGAIVIGDVIIADNCFVGAGAVVTKSCLIKGASIVGNNRIIEKENNSSNKE